MMIRARHHWFLYPFFQVYTRYIIRRNFHAIRTYDCGTSPVGNRSVLIVANHISWWDGFWLAALNMKRFKKKFYFMMLEQQLRHYSFFRFCGGFSIKPGARSVFESIHYAAEILSNPHHLLVMFPQGKIHSIYERSFLFSRGIERILHRTQNPVSLMMVVHLVDYFSSPKPSLYQYVREYEFEGFNFHDFCSAYRAFYEECLSRQIARESE